MKRLFGIICIFCWLANYAYAFPVKSTRLGSSVGSQTILDVSSINGSNTFVNTLIGSIDLTKKWAVVLKPAFIWGDNDAITGTYLVKIAGGVQYTQALDYLRSNFVQLVPGYACNVVRAPGIKNIENYFAWETYSEVWPAKILNINIDANLLAGTGETRKDYKYTSIDFDLVLRPLILVLSDKFNPLFISVGPLANVGCAANPTDDMWSVRYRLGGVIQFKTSLTGMVRNAVITTMIAAGYTGSSDCNKNHLNGGFVNIEVDTAFW